MITLFVFLQDPFISNEKEDDTSLMRQLVLEVHGDYEDTMEEGVSASALVSKKLKKVVNKLVEACSTGVSDFVVNTTLVSVRRVKIITNRVFRF